LLTSIRVDHSGIAKDDHEEGCPPPRQQGQGKQPFPHLCRGKENSTPLVFVVTAGGAAGGLSLLPLHLYLE